MNAAPEGLAWDMLIDPAYYEAKNRLSGMVKDLLGSCSENMKQELRDHPWLPQEALISNAKITRGDNYTGKPWMVLDYPRVFEKDSVFAFRTLFLFGDAVHCTFHISGRFLNSYPQLPLTLSSMEHPELLLCNEGSPWIHHVNSGVYLPVSANFDKPHDLHGFIKFGKMIPYNSWNTLPEEVIKFFRQISDILKR